MMFNVEQDSVVIMKSVTAVIDIYLKKQCEQLLIL